MMSEAAVFPAVCSSSVFCVAEESSEPQLSISIMVAVGRICGTSM